MGRFSLCLCGRREPGLRVRTDPAHAMLEEQLRASASPQRSAMCPTGPAEGSGPRGLSTHRVESLSEAAQGASGPLGPADLRVPFQAAGPDSRRVWCRARCRAAPGAGSRGPRPPPRRTEAGPGHCFSRRQLPPGSAHEPRRWGGEQSRGQLRRPPGGGGAERPPGGGQRCGGQGLAPWDWGARRPARPLGGEGAAGCPPPKRCSVARPPAGAARAVPELGARARKARQRAAAEGAGAEATARPATLPTRTRTGNRPARCLCRGRLRSQPSVSGSAPWGLPGHLL